MEFVSTIAVLQRVGDVLAARRGKLIEVAAAETGKTIDQADPEVSEAVDFCRHYAELSLQLEDPTFMCSSRFEPVEVTVVASPWNFPLAIPVGGVAAALASGSTAVLKPAPPARRCAAELVRAFHDAGVPEEVLALAAVEDGEVSRHLVVHDGVGRVILTGSYDTARMFRSWRPDMRLLGETSGKNAMIVTPSADPDLAVRDVISSTRQFDGYPRSGKTRYGRRRKRAKKHCVRRLRRRILFLAYFMVPLFCCPAHGAAAGGGAERGELVGQAGLAGEGLDAGVDGLDRAGVDVDADDLMALLGVLDGQGQADLAQSDDGDAHADWSFRRVGVGAHRMTRLVRCGGRKGDNGHAPSSRPEPTRTTGPYGHAHRRARIPPSPDVADVDPRVLPRREPVAPPAPPGRGPRLRAAPAPRAAHRSVDARRGARRRSAPEHRPRAIPSALSDPVCEAQFGNMQFACD